MLAIGLMLGGTIGLFLGATVRGVMHRGFGIALGAPSVLVAQDPAAVVGRVEVHDATPSCVSTQAWVSR